MKEDKEETARWEATKAAPAADISDYKMETIRDPSRAGPMFAFAMLVVVVLILVLVMS